MQWCIVLNVVLAAAVVGLGIALRHARARQQEQHTVIHKLRIDLTAHENYRRGVHAIIDRFNAKHPRAYP